MEAREFTEHRKKWRRSWVKKNRAKLVKQAAARYERWVAVNREKRLAYLRAYNAKRRSSRALPLPAKALPRSRE